MTPQEAINRISKIPVRPKPDNALDLVAIIEAQKALVKQIPQKPLGDLHSVPHYRCPNCHRTAKLFKDSSVFLHCHWCGQALDWGNEE